MFRRKREEWRQPVWPEIERYLWWIVFTIILAWAFYQLYALLLYVNVVWVNNEQWRLPGWYPFTIGALTRFTGFALGTVWLARRRCDLRCAVSSSPGCGSSGRGRSSGVRRR